VKELKNDRDASVDRLLAGTLKARQGAAPAGACLDAETLAAWADQALDARELAIAEAHAADCGRCQALLAAMVRTAPPAAAATPSWWRMPALGWLVPLTAAATAVAIWVAVPNRAPVQVSDGGVAAVDKAVPADRAAAADQAAPAQVPARPTASAPAPPAELQAKAAENVSPAAVRERQESAALDKQTAAQSLPAPAGALAESITITPAAPADADALRPRTAPGEPRALGAASARMSTFANAMQVVIVSSNPATRFRLLPGGGVQRSADGGATWRTEVTGATDTLTAGASPSPSVCWLIGPSGAVFLSTDGRSWRRLAFPEAEDLRAVTASDKENATITTVSGHIFVTADAGQTWARSPDI
jgi:bacterioferritin-associated ferredoxin